MFEGGIFGDLFDLNGDGKMDAGEMALEFMVIDEITKGEDDVDEDTPFDTGCCDYDQWTMLRVINRTDIQKFDKILQKKMELCHLFLPFKSS